MPQPRALRDPVTIYLDGEAITAESGEPVAVALLAAGRVALARSPKFHRPRGPACLRGACDGCLARVDDTPNVMTCRVAAAEGLRVETQNVAGSRETDLLRVTDWFFPEGMNPHELLAGVPGAGRVMQALARQVAGLGKLPRARLAPAASRRREADVLVVGAGPSGMATACALAGQGRRVEVVDDDLEEGGSLCGLAGEARRPWQPVLATFRDEVSRGRVELRLGSTAAGIYGDDVLVGSAEGVEVVTARTLVLATGAHDGAVPFEGNDLPGIVGARAAGRLLGRGVHLGAREVVVVLPGGGPFGTAYAAERRDATLVEGTPVRAHGSSRIRRVTIATLGGELDVRCDALVIDAPRAPAYELCAQAGAELSHEEPGFVVRAGPGGRIRDGVHACGETVGTPFDPAAIAKEAQALAELAGRAG
jgi:sarcosine oxidase subunit alpha